MYFVKGIAISQVKEKEVKGKTAYKLAVLCGEKNKDGFYDPEKLELAIVYSSEPILDGKTFKYGAPVLMEVDVSVFDGQKTTRYSNVQLIG